MNKVVSLKSVQRGRINSTISPSVRVAVGDVHLPFLTLVKASSECFICLHEKRCLPDIRKMTGNKEGVLYRGDLKYITTDEKSWQTLLEAIKEHEKHQGYHINSHTFIVAWCLSKGFDLYKEGVFSL